MQKFCTNCGNQFNDAARFCNKCGATLGGPQAQPPVRATVVSPPSAPEPEAAAPAPSTQVWPAASASTQPQNPSPTAPQYQTPPPAQMPPPPAYGSSYPQQQYQQQPSYQQQPQYQQPAAGAGLQQNIAGLLCYITVIPAIIFLVLEPYNKNRFIRFHAFQCIFLFIAWIALWVVTPVLQMILPGILDLIVGLASMALGLGFLVVWIFMMVKAYSNEMYQLPVIGDLAAQQAG